VVKVEGHLDR
jgi:hypothetical protein